MTNSERIREKEKPKKETSAKEYKPYQTYKIITYTGFVLVFISAYLNYEILSTTILGTVLTMLIYIKYKERKLGFEYTIIVPLASYLMLNYMLIIGG
jgi:hypothetical protein